MADQKPENNPIDPEMAKLRNIVLKWIAEKREAVQAKPAILNFKEEPAKAAKIPPVPPLANKPIKPDLPKPKEITPPPEIKAEVKEEPPIQVDSKLRSTVLKWLDQPQAGLAKPAESKSIIKPVKPAEIPPIVPLPKISIKPILKPAEVKKETPPPIDKKARSIILKWFNRPAAKPEKKEMPAQKKPILAETKKPAAPKKKAPLTPIPAKPIKPLLKPSAGLPAPRLLLPPGRKKPLLKIIAGAFISAFLFFLAFSLGLYFFTWQNQVAAVIVRIIPYPAAFVDGQPIYYCQWQKEVSAVNNFYLKQKALDPNLALPDLKQTKKSVLQRMIDEQIANQLAKKYQVAVSAEEIGVQTQKLVNEIGGQAALEKQIRELYGWSLADFQNEIIKLMLLKNKLDLALIVDGEYNKSAQETIQMISGEIKNGRKSFAELAKLYSQDITGVQGGDLGYFGRGEMLLEIEDAAFNLAIGQVSGIIKTHLGYHLIKLEEKLTDENGNLAKVRASQILIKGKNLDNLIKDMKAKIKIWQLVRI